jgi:hypothetical protein
MEKYGFSCCLKEHKKEIFLCINPSLSVRVTVVRRGGGWLGVWVYDARTGHFSCRAWERKHKQ